MDLIKIKFNFYTRVHRVLEGLGTVRRSLIPSRFRFSLLFALILFLPRFVNAQAPSKIELLKQKQQLLREIEATNKILNETEKNKKTSIKELRILNSQIQSRQNLIQNINSQVNNLDNEISDNKSNVNSLQKSLNKLKREYAAMIRYAYINQGAYKRLSFVFASSSFNQAYKRLKSLQQFSNYRQEQVDAIQNTENKINNKIKILDKNKLDKARMLSEKEREKRQLDKIKQVQSKKVIELQNQSQDLQKKLNADQRKRYKVENAIQAAIRKEIEEARIRAEEEEKNRSANNLSPRVTIPKNSKGGENLILTPESEKLSNDFLDNKGHLPWPVERRGKITEPFGVYKDPLQPKVTHDSKEITFEVANNASVRAVFSGTVSIVSSIGGAYLVVIKHGEYFTAYSNLLSVSVHAGEKINTKQVLGIAASDPDDGSTVSFSIFKGKQVLNPLTWLNN
jgi:septal ring factor EnvC (AmiA/AmiB activator)